MVSNLFKKSPLKNRMLCNFMCKLCMCNFIYICTNQWRYSIRTPETADLFFVKVFMFLLPFSNFANASNRPDWSVIQEPIRPQIWLSFMFDNYKIWFKYTEIQSVLLLSAKRNFKLIKCIDFSGCRCAHFYKRKRNQTKKKGGNKMKEKNGAHSSNRSHVNRL